MTSKRRSRTSGKGLGKPRLARSAPAAKTPAASKTRPRRDTPAPTAVAAIPGGRARRPTPDPLAGARDEPFESFEAMAERLREQAETLALANAELRNLNRNLDQIVRQRTRALAESEAQLRRQNVELDRLNRMKTEFISIAAHELRTPLTSIVGYLDLITEGRFGQPLASLARPLASVRRNAHRLRRLVEDMLDASRIETGRLALLRAPCVLAEIVNDVLEEMRPLAERKGQSLTADMVEIPRVDGDRDKLHQVLCNLVANSVKYTPEGGRIQLSVDTVSDDSGDRRARVRVLDNGIGVPAGQRSRVFEPFSDINSARHHTSDTPDSAGLGLYIARRLVELHSGRIDVESEEGKFTELTVLLPLAAAPPSA
jgi:signal transduction histidine kinase